MSVNVYMFLFGGRALLLLLLLVMVVNGGRTNKPQQNTYAVLTLFI